MEGIGINVLKKSGKLEAFKLEKIIDSVMAAGLDSTRARQLALEVSKKAYPNIPTSKIRKLVYKQLCDIDKAIARAYERYEQTKLRPSH